MPPSSRLAMTRERWAMKRASRLTSPASRATPRRTDRPSRGTKRSTPAEVIVPLFEGGFGRLDLGLECGACLGQVWSRSALVFGDDQIRQYVSSLAERLRGSVTIVHSPSRHTRGNAKGPKEEAAPRLRAASSLSHPNGAVER
jgi:hypothetical protein